jgi:hypothetical protein
VTSPVDIPKLLGMPPAGFPQSFPAAVHGNLTPGLQRLLRTLRRHTATTPANSGCIKDFLDCEKVGSTRIQNSLIDIRMIRTFINLLELGKAVDLSTIPSQPASAAASGQATPLAGKLERKIARLIMASPLIAPGSVADDFPGLGFLRAELVKEDHMGVSLHRHKAHGASCTAARVTQLTLLLNQALDVS